MTIHTYKIVKGDPLDIARIAQSEFLTKLETLPGFRQFHLIEGEDGELLIVGQATDEAATGARRDAAHGDEDAVGGLPVTMVDETLEER